MEKLKTLRVRLAALSRWDHQSMVLQSSLRMITIVFTVALMLAALLLQNEWLFVASMSLYGPSELVTAVVMARRWQRLITESQALQKEIGCEPVADTLLKWRYRYLELLQREHEMITAMAIFIPMTTVIGINLHKIWFMVPSLLALGLRLLQEVDKPRPIAGAPTIDMLNTGI